MITPDGIEILHAARRILERVDHDAMRGSFESEPWEAAGRGRTAEAASTAANAIFEFLNVASNYGKLNLTHEQLHGRPKDEEVEVLMPDCLNIERIDIESEEDGFWILLTHDEGQARYRIQDADLDAFYDQVKGRIGPYLQEKEAAYQEFKRAVEAGAFRCDPDESGGILVGIREDGSEHWEEDSDRKYDQAKAKEDGYDFSNPKHPRYHSVHVDHYDNREKA